MKRPLIDPSEFGQEHSIGCLLDQIRILKAAVAAHQESMKIAAAEIERLLRENQDLRERADRMEAKPYGPY